MLCGVSDVHIHTSNGVSNPTELRLANKKNFRANITAKYHTETYKVKTILMLSPFFSSSMCALHTVSVLSVTLITASDYW